LSKPFLGYKQPLSGSGANKRGSNLINRVCFVSSKRLSHLTIVIVDDNSDVRRFVGAFLGHMGANITVAQSAIEGLEAIKACQPDLVLSDISMPGRDGFDLLRDIRALAPEAGGRVPVIAMTALVAHLDGARFLNAGFQAFLPKPFNPDKLVEVIQKVLNH
jgi:CheY-like chemotaxis protein